MTEQRASGRLFTLGEILAATGGALAFPAGSSVEIRSVSIDSRKTEKGALFVALAGERTDGHDHIRQAVERGAVALLVAEEKARLMGARLHEASGGVAVITVPATLAGLQRLARFHMERLHAVTRVGVTGSNGKTTTKEIIGSILSFAAATAVNEGNLNSEIGLPVACFAVGSAHRYAIFEMGMNHRGEMDVLADIVRPDLALITNIGSAHIGLLGSHEEIVKEKKRIFAHFTGPQTGFLPEGEPFAAMLQEGVKGRIVYFGPRSTRGFEGSESLGLDGTLINWEGFRIRFPLFGRYNLSNALGAISLTREMGVSADAIREGLETVNPLFGRSQVIRGPVTVVFDCYNANPDSMEKALAFLESLAWSGRKIAVLGGMRELGDASSDAHRALGRRLSSNPPDAVLLFGEEMEETWRALAGSPLADRSRWTGDFPTLASMTRDLVHEGDIILIKGSRGMELERLIPELNVVGSGMPRQPEHREVSCS
jgi:UDP-N-acetylmuramoyl-tripeptide--D-alanyl-D-alanine ligase